MRRVAVWLFALFLAVYILPLGVRPLSSPDEVRYGAIAHEMLVSGDWVSPRFNGARYFEKPIMGHWLNAVSMGVLGERPFALRLPTALAAGLTALTIGLLTAQFAGRRSGVAAAAIYLSMFLVAGIGTTAVLDTFLTLFLTLALATYFLAVRGPPGRSRAAWLAACGIACGAAFLTKGFLAFAVPVLVAVAFLAIEKRWRDLFATAWLPILLAAAVIAPWAVSIHLREPDFWHYFFWVEHIQRYTSESAQHPQPFWFFFAAAPLVGFPWIWMLPAAVQGLRASRAERAYLVYLACWLILPWLFFSASRGKLITYVLPCFPPLAMLIAVGLENYRQQASRKFWRIGASCVAAILLLALAALGLAQSGAFGAPLFQSFEFGKLVFVALCLCAGVAAAVAAAVLRRSAGALVTLGATGVVLIFLLNLGLPRKGLDEVAPQALLNDGVLAAPDAVVVSDASTFGAVAWYTKRDDIYVLSPGELGYGLGYEDSRSRNLLGGGLARLISENAQRRDVFIVTRPMNEAQIDAPLPSGATRTERGGIVRWHIPAAAEQVPHG